MFVCQMQLAGNMFPNFQNRFQERFGKFALCRSAVKGVEASLYVGESARSLNERAGEHWPDAEAGKEESHMVEHQALAHGGERTPEFNFIVGKQCKSSLERLVREAVRIDMRGNVINIKGIYNS